MEPDDLLWANLYCWMAFAISVLGSIVLMLSTIRRFISRLHRSRSAKGPGRESDSTLGGKD